MIAFITLMALMASWLIATALNRTNAELNNERERTARDALQKAKAALLAYAASEQWQQYKGEVWQPGAMPCPDRDGDGASDCLLPHANSSVGRIPWRTLGIDQLRDATGETLWYALSGSFRKASSNIINSDTAGQLTVTGASPASNVVAVVFAPGAVLAGQNRPADTTQADHNAVANYLERYNVAHATNHVFSSQTRATDDFNDRLLVITQADLMAAVEPVVAAQIERDVKPYLTTYASAWGRFPFPSAFASPSPGNSPNAASTRPQSTYLGSAAETAGLLPMASVTYSWTAGSGSVSQVSGTGLVLFPGTPCNVVGTAMRCDFSIVGTGVFQILSNVRIRVQGQIPNVGMSLATMPSGSAVTFMECSGYSLNCLPTTAFSSPSFSGTVSAAGVGTIAYEGTYNACVLFCVVKFFQVSIPIVTASPLTDPAAVTAASWFINNEWYRQTYYAVSSGNVPGGAGCVAGGMPACLSVSDLPPRYATSNDKQAVLVFAGQSLNGSVRPSATLGDYLESQNAVVDSQFQHRAGVPTSINDRVVVLAP